MKKYSLIILSLMAFLPLIMADQNPDFSVTNLFESPTGFLHIQLENRSQKEITITEEMKEKIFLTVYINQVKRAEFPIKYLNPALFKKNGRVIHKTNFRAIGPLAITVKINPGRIILETNFTNNELTKEIHGEK